MFENIRDINDDVEQMAYKFGVEGSNQQEQSMLSGGTGVNNQQPRWGMNGGDLNQSIASSSSYNSRGWGGGGGNNNYGRHNSGFTEHNY